MTLLLDDPGIRSLGVQETGEALVPLPRALCDAGRPAVFVRESLALRLQQAQQLLPRRVRLLVVEGHRSLASQSAIYAQYEREIAAEYPALSAAEQRRLVSRFVAPLEVAPHVAGAAVDVTLARRRTPLWMGTPINATPEASAGACMFAATGIGRRARRNRDLLALVLGAVGLVNYPTEWWHWSFGDRYWAHTVGAAHALYGPVDAPFDALTSSGGSGGSR